MLKGLSYVLTCDVECCLSAASQQRLVVVYVVPRLTLALIVVVTEVLVDLVLADVDARLKVGHPAARVHDVLVDLLGRRDPLTATLDVDLDGRGGAARQRHWTTFHDVVDRVWLDHEDWGLRVRCHLGTGRRHRCQDA